MINFTEQEIELFNAAKNYALKVNKKISCKPFQELSMKRSYEIALERLGAASLDYAFSVKSPPYDK